MDPLGFREVQCPYCGERIEIQVDGSAGEQSYVEDCSVCCRPILLEVTMSPDGIDTVRATRGD